jgi:hypothetical protein
MVMAVIRWARTPENHADHQPRADMARLMAVMLLGPIGDIARSRFPERSGPWIAISAALIPVACAALWLIWRLFGAYRAAPSKPAVRAFESPPARKSEDATLPDVETVRSRIRDGDGTSTP